MQTCRLCRLRPRVMSAPESPRMARIFRGAQTSRTCTDEGSWDRVFRGGPIKPQGRCNTSCSPLNQKSSFHFSLSFFLDIVQGRAILASYLHYSRQFMRSLPVMQNESLSMTFPHAVWNPSVPFCTPSTATVPILPGYRQGCIRENERIKLGQPAYWRESSVQALPIAWSKTPPWGYVVHAAYKISRIISK